MMSVRFGSGALRGVMCVYLYFGGDGKRELAICLQRGGACLSSSALHWTALCCYSVQLLLKHSVQLLPWSFCDSASPPEFRKGVFTSSCYKKG